MKSILSASVVLLSLSLPAVAAGQELGSKRDAVFSAERMMAVGATHVAGERGTATYSDDWTSISFGWRGAAQLSPFDVPRIAFDYLALEHLSIGGSLGYVSLDSDQGGASAAFVLAPRVGYLHAFGRVVGIWPRGGFTYHSLNVDNQFDEKGFALSLECPFTFSPASHFAFQVGPSFDLDMFGSRNVPPTGKGDRTYRSFALNAGLLGWF